MRRLLCAVLMLASAAVVPPATARPGAAPAGGVPHAGSFDGDSGRDWLAEQHRAQADLSERSRELYRWYQRETAGAAVGETYDIDGVYRLGGDVDGDGVHDFARYRSEFSFTQSGPEGWAEYTVYSGRTGARYWTRRFPGLALAGERFGLVGNRRPGLVLVQSRWGPGDVAEIRVVGVDARRGTVAYDKTFSDADGKGYAQFGGVFDAYPGGGTDVLVGRYRRVPVPFEDQSLYDYEPYVLDGADGTVRQVQPTATGIAAGIRFLAVGDLDGDRRDDFVRVRREFRDVGTVTALGVAEEQFHWERGNVPLARAVSVASAQITGSRDDDVFVLTTTKQTGLLEIPGVTDGLPLLDGPRPGGHGLLFDGATGELRFHHHVAEDLGYMWPFADATGDGKAEVLVETYVEGKRDGVRILLLDGAGRDVLRRDLTTKPLPGRTTMLAAAYGAGDLDGDGVPDLAYVVYSESPIQQKVVTGFYLTGSDRSFETDDQPFYGTLDGRGDERLKYAASDGRVRLTVADGARGAAYWTVSVVVGTGYAALDRHPGARGRCSGAVLWGSAGIGKAYWLDVLDGRTGRVRWSRTFGGTRPAGSRPVASGRPASCR